MPLKINASALNREHQRLLHKESILLDRVQSLIENSILFRRGWIITQVWLCKTLVVIGRKRAIKMSLTIVGRRWRAHFAQRMRQFEFKWCVNEKSTTTVTSSSSSASVKPPNCWSRSSKTPVKTWVCCCYQQQTVEDFMLPANKRKRTLQITCIWCRVHQKWCLLWQPPSDCCFPDGPWEHANVQMLE